MAGDGVSNPAGLAASALLRNLLGGARDLALYPFERRVPREWVVLRLERGLAEAEPPSSWLPAPWRPPPVLHRVLEGLGRAATDPGVRGVLVRVGAAPLGWSKVASLVRAIGRLRAGGKRVIVYATRTGNAGAWLGAAADQLWLAPEGRVDLLGVRAASPFLRGVLDRLEIRPDVLATGRYKSVGEQLTRSAMSESAREVLEEVVAELYDGLVAGLAAGPAGSAERAREWIDGGPYAAAEALEMGLADALVYPDELAERLARLDSAAPDDAEVEDAKRVPFGTYLRVSRRRFGWTPLSVGPRVVALVPLVGMLRSATASPRGLAGVLGRLARSDAVRAVVLRIECPGGDALASDLLWRAVRKLAERKPVVASLGDVAASGGYYAAVGASEIVAEAGTLTGSIGVAMLWLETDSFLEKLGVTFDAVERGRHAGIYDMSRARTHEERALLRRQVDRLYRGFVDRVAEGRGLAPAEVERVAQGRVWTGAQAAERGLVDRLGGVDLAIERARALAGLAPGEGELAAVAPAPGPAAQLFRPEPADAFWEAALLCSVQIPLR